MIWRLSVFFVAALQAWPAWALSFAVQSNSIPGLAGRPAQTSTVIRITGRFEPGDSERLRDTLTMAHMQSRGSGNAPSLLTAELSSNGGDIYEGLKIGYMFREFAVSTMVRRGDVCLSACALAFLGGTESSLPVPVPGRSIEIGGQVGFHNFRINPSGVQKPVPETPANGMIVGFDLARGGASMLVSYASAMNIDMAFVARLLGRPPEEWEYVDLAGEFIDLASCPISVGFPRIESEKIATNVCNNAMDVSGRGLELGVRRLKEYESKRHLLQHVQLRVAQYNVRGPLAAELAAVIAAPDERLVDQVYADLRSAGVALPEVVGPTYEVLGYKVGGTALECHVSFSLDNPDRYGVLLVSEAGISGPRREPPRQCRRLMLYDRFDMLNPPRK